MHSVSAREAGDKSLLRALADEASDALARQVEVVGLCLIGSVARGNERPTSDVDLIVLCEAPCSARRLLTLLPAAIDGSRLTLLPYTNASWQRQVDRGDLFLTHVAGEGIVLYDRDGRMAAALASVRERVPDVKGEKERQIARLNPYRDARRLKGNCLFALARAYSVGKALAIAHTVELGAPTFVKEEAFTSVARRRPHLAPAVATLRQLRPFYDVTLGRFPQPLPFDYHGAEAHLADAIRAADQLADG